jgi:hypothetical protein
LIGIRIQEHGLTNFLCCFVARTSETWWIFDGLSVNPPHNSFTLSQLCSLFSVSRYPVSFRENQSTVYTYWVFPVVSQPSKELSQANDVVVLFLGPCLVLGKARTFCHRPSMFMLFNNTVNTLAQESWLTFCLQDPDKNRN